MNATASPATRLAQAVLLLGCSATSPQVFARLAESQDASETRQPHERRDDPQLPGTPHVAGAARGPVYGPDRGLPFSVQVNIDADGANIRGDAANEPSIAIDPTNPSRIAIGWRQFDTIASNFRQAGYAYSRDAGRTWTFPGVLDPGVFRSDPVLRPDAQGRFYYYSLLEDYDCSMFLSDDGGRSWSGPIEAFGGDKAWISVDRTGGMGHGNVYIAWDQYNCCGNRIFTLSRNRGLTYRQPVPIAGFPIWGTSDVAVDGTVYVGGLGHARPEDFVVAWSVNAQQPGTPPTFEYAELYLGGIHRGFAGGPNPGGLLGQVWIACDRSDGPNRGNLYALCSVRPFEGGDPLDVAFSRSVDGGRTWSLPVRVNDDVSTQNWQWFGTMSVAPSGRIDVIWNDTRNGPNFRISQLFYSFSIDGGESFSPNVAVSLPFDSTVGWPNQNKLGDYYDMASDDVGVSVAYAATFNGEQDVYFMRIGDSDCNGNGVGDSTDLSNGTSSDLNGNDIPDECDGLGDLNCDDALDAFDLEPFIQALVDPAGYAIAYPGCEIERADVNGDGSVDAFDIEGLIELLLG